MASRPAAIATALLTALVVAFAVATPGIRSRALRLFGLSSAAAPDENLRPIFNALQLEGDRAAVGRRYGRTTAELDAIEAQGRAAGWTVPKRADSSGDPGQEILDLEQQGLLTRLDVQNHSAHVDPVKWARIDADRKRA